MDTSDLICGRIAAGEKYNLTCNTYEQGIDVDMSQVISGLISTAYSKDSFWAASEEARNDIATFLSSLTNDVFDSLSIDTSNEYAVKAWVESIIDEFATNGDFAQAWNDLFALDPNSMSAQQFITQVNSYMDAIANALGLDDEGKKQFLISLGFDFDTTQASINGLKSKLQGSSIPSAGVTSAAIGSANGNDEVDKFADSLTQADLKIANSDVFQKAVEDRKTALNGATLTAQDYNNVLEEVKNTESSMPTEMPTFEDVWNSEDLDKVRDKLLDLAKSGEITADTISSTGDYIKLIDATGLSAKQAKTKILDMLDPGEKLNAASQGVGKLATAYREFKENGFSSISSLEGLPDVFKQLESYDTFEKIAGDAKSSSTEIQDAYNQILTEYIQDQQILRGATEETKNFYITQLKEMGVANAEECVQEYIDNQNKLKQMENDFLAHCNKKGEISSEWLASESSKSGTLINALASAYGDDFNNWCRLLSEKAKAYNEFVKAVNSSSALGAKNKGLTGKGDFGVISDQEKGKAYAQYKQAEAAYNEANEVIKFDMTEINTNFGGKLSFNGGGNTNKTGTKGKNKGKSGSDSKTQIDWLARALEVLQSKIDLTKSKFDTLFTYKSKDNSLKKQITDTTKLLKAEGIAADRYLSKFNSYTKNTGLSKDLISNIKNGKLKGKNLIAEYGSKTANKINQAQEYWDNYQDATKAYFDKVAEVADLVQQRIDLVTDKFNTKRDKLDASQSLLESKYENIGVSDTTGRNKNLKSQISKAKEIRDSYADELTAKTKIRTSYGNSATKNLKKSNVKKKYQKDFANIKKKIKEYIKNGKVVPDSLIAKTDDPLATNLIKYNTSVDDVTEATRNKKKADEDYKATKREKTIEQYQNNANEKKQIQEINKQLANNASSYEERNQYEEKALEHLRAEYEWQIKIAKANGDDLEAKRLGYELIEKERDAYLTMFQNISEGYDNVIKQYTHMNTLIDKAISKQQAQGHFVSDNYYNEQIAQNEIQLKSMTAEYNELLADFNSGKFAYGTKQWIEARDVLFSLQEGIEDVQNNLVSLYNTIRDNDYVVLEKQIQYITDMVDEQNFLADLMKEHNLFNDNGSLNNYGQSTSALYAGMLKSYKEEAEEYGKKAAEVLKQYNEKALSGDYDINLYEKYQEYLKAQREAIKNTISQKNAIKDLIKQSYEKLVSYLDKIIGRYKKALEAESDLHDFQKSIKEKTTNVTKLNAQIQALKGDDSEEGRNKMQKLMSELADAEEDLQETEYNQWKKDQNEMLDTLSEEMSEWLQELLANEQAIEQKIQEQINAANANAGSISNTITTEVGKVGYTMSSEIQQAVGSSNGIFNAISNSVTAIKDMIAEWKAKSDTEAQTKVEFLQSQQQGLTMDKPTTQTQQQTNTNPNTNSDSVKDFVNKFNSGEITTADIINASKGQTTTISTNKTTNASNSAFELGEKKESKEDKAKDYITQNLHTSTKDVDAMCDINKALYKDKANFYSGTKKVLNQSQLETLCDILGITYDGKDKNSTLYKKLTKMGVLNGYAHGGRINDKDGIDLKDLGIRASNGDTKLVPVQNKEGILTEKQTDAVEDLAITLDDGSVLTPYTHPSGLDENLAKFMSMTPNYGLSTFKDSVPNVGDVVTNNNTSQNVSVAMGDIVVQGVQDTKAFAKELKKVMCDDRSVQKVTQSITVDLLAGKNSLACNKHR